MVEKRKSQDKVKVYEIIFELRMEYYMCITKGTTWRAKTRVD